MTVAVQTHERLPCARLFSFSQQKGCRWNRLDHFYKLEAVLSVPCYRMSRSLCSNAGKSPG